MTSLVATTAFAVLLRLQNPFNAPEPPPYTSEQYAASLEQAARPRSLLADFMFSISTDTCTCVAIKLSPTGNALGTVHECPCEE